MMNTPDITFKEENNTSVVLHKTVAQDLLNNKNKIPDGSVDLLLTDPPYIISRESGFSKLDEHGVGSGLTRFQTYQTDFGGWDRDEFTMEDLEGVVASVPRVLKPGGVAIIFFDLWKSSTLMEMLEDVGLENVRMIEWLKTNAVPINSRANYLSNSREIAIVGTKPGAKHDFSLEHHSGIFRHPIYHAKDRFHPTQKSLKLFEELIDIHTQKGDTVLDCFSGSATTGVAAANTGRHYIGCEPDTEFFTKSSERLSAALAKKQLQAEGVSA